MLPPGDYFYIARMWVPSSDDDVLIEICVQFTVLMTFC